MANRVCLTRSPSGRVPSPGASSRMERRRAGDHAAGVRHKRRPGCRLAVRRPLGHAMCIPRPYRRPRRPRTDRIRRARLCIVGRHARANEGLESAVRSSIGASHARHAIGDGLAAGPARARRWPAVRPTHRPPITCRSPVPRPRGGGASRVRSSAARTGRGGSIRPSASSTVSACARARAARSRWAVSWSDATRSRGRPLWARPRTLPSLRSSKSFSARANPSCVSATALSRAWADLVGGVRDEDAERLHGAAPDPAAQLVELGEPEPVGALDDHHRRGRARRPRPRRRSCRRARPARRPGSGSSRRRVPAGFIRPWTMPTRSGSSSALSRTRLGLGGDGALGLVGAFLDQRARRRTSSARAPPPRGPCARSRPARPGGGCRSGSGRGRPVACAGRRRRGRRRGPGRACAGSASRSSAARAASGRRPWPRAGRAGRRRSDAARR